MLTLKCSSNNGDDFSQKLINTANRILELRGRPKIENEKFLKTFIFAYFVPIFCLIPIFLVFYSNFSKGMLSSFLSKKWNEAKTEKIVLTSFGILLLWIIFSSIYFRSNSHLNPFLKVTGVIAVILISSGLLFCNFLWGFYKNISLPKLLLYIGGFIFFESILLFSILYFFINTSFVEFVIKNLYLLTIILVILIVCIIYFLSPDSVNNNLSKSV